MARPIAKAKLARRKGVSRQSLTPLTREGGKLHPAVLPDGRMDLDHPAVLEWLGVAAESDDETDDAPEAERARPAERERAPTTVDAIPAFEGLPTPDMPALVRMSLGEICERFGTLPGFDDHVSVRKKIEETHKLEIANAERRGEVIEREFVQVHVFGVIRALTRRILRDAPRTLSKEIYALAQAGRPIEDAERLIRDVIGTQIESAKRKVASAIGPDGSVPEDGEDG